MQRRNLSLIQIQSLEHRRTLLCFPASTAQFVYITTVISGLAYANERNFARARTLR